jgi:dethiobiotin synthetase
MKKNSRGIFITATDTGVGKTYVASGIARALRQDGIDVGVMKPAETGCRRRSGKLVPADAIRLMKASHAEDSLELVNPFRLSKPLAPSVAAASEGKRIVPAKIIKAFRVLAKRHDFMLVEGAGGIMVPLTRDYLYLDLAVDLGLPVLIIARPGLGTINHTLLTISALKGRQIPIAGVVINYALDWKRGVAESTSPAEIEAVSGVPVLDVLAYGGAMNAELFEAVKKASRL